MHDSPFPMNERLQAIDAAIQFVESRLRDPIAVADIAAAAGYSLYHFIRTFNQTVQHTPYDYLMRRRLSEAARELLAGDRRVIDIALDFQFNNHETFTRAFGRIFGMPPTQWREQGGRADQRVLMPAISREYLEYITAPDFEPPRLVRLDGIILAGLMAPLTADPETLPSLWRNLRGALRGWPEKPGRPEKPGPLTASGLREFWGVRILPPMPGGNSFYLAAAQIPALDAAPPGFVTKIIPAGDYVCLTQPKPTADLDLGLVYLRHTFFPKSGMQLLDPLEIERFGERREILIPVRGSRPATKE